MDAGARREPTDCTRVGGLAHSGVTSEVTPRPRRHPLDRVAPGKAGRTLAPQWSAPNSHPERAVPTMPRTRRRSPRRWRQMWYAALTLRAATSRPGSVQNGGTDRGREVAARHREADQGDRRRRHSFVTATDRRRPRYGRRPGRPVRQVGRYQQIADPSGRGQAWTTGPVEVSSSPSAAQGHAARDGRRRPGWRAGPAACTSRASWTSCSSRSACPGRVRPVDDDRQPGPLRHRRHRDVRRRGCGRGGHEARVDDRHVRGRRAGEEDRHDAADLRRVPRGRTVDPVAT